MIGRNVFSVRQAELAVEATVRLHRLDRLSAPSHV